jgi:hypothetical protein
MDFGQWPHVSKLQLKCILNNPKESKLINYWLYQPRSETQETQCSRKQNQNPKTHKWTQEHSSYSCAL